MCFVSGQLSVSSDGMYVSETALEEGKLAFGNFFSAIKNSGFKKEDTYLMILPFMI